MHTSGLYLVGNGDKALPEVLNTKGLYVVLFRSVETICSIFFTEFYFYFQDLTLFFEQSALLTKFFLLLIPFSH